jgi:predicted transcriptional regulator
VDIGALDEGLDGLSRAWATGMAELPRYSFASYESMSKVLAPNRMAIIKVMMGVGPVSIREVARRVGRDFKGVHSDVTVLFSNGLLYKSADGRLIFPYDKIHFDFEVSAQTAA